MLTWGKRVRIGARSGRGQSGASGRIGGLGRIGVATLTVGLLAAGCTGPAADPSPGVQSAPEPEAIPIEFAEVDQGLVEGVEEGSLSNPDAGVESVRFPILGKTRNLSLAVELATNKGLRNNATAAGSDYQQGWTVIGASPDAVGLLLTTTAVVDGAERIAPAAVWFDPSTNRGVAGPGLIKLDSWQDFADAVIESAPPDVEPETVLNALSSQSAPYGDGPAIGFDAAGDVVVQFGSDVLSEPVMIPAADVSSLLSPFGADAQAAASAPSAFKPGDKVEKRDRKESIGGEDNEAAAGSSEDEPEVIEIPEGPGGSGGDAADEPTLAPAVRPYPWVGVNCDALECVAMTYDDGPGPRTDEITETYLAGNQALTFFQLGQVIENDPSLASLAAARGMELASHSYSHADLRGLSEQGMEDEFADTAALLKKASGRTPLFTRAPYGAVNEDIRKAAKKQGVSIISWTVDTRDWASGNASSTTSSANSAQPDDVVLMHDIQENSADAAPAIVDNLVEREVTSVTVGEISDYGWRAGEVYPEGAYGSA